MPRSFKILLIGCWVLLILATTSMLAALYIHKPESAELKLIAPAPKFSLIDQNGKPISQDNLHGAPYIVDLIFTRCGSICPVMTSKMGQLQQKLTGTGVKFVSISVDPEFDTPKVLKDYAQAHHADESTWLFLTGPEKSIEQTARGYLLGFEPASTSEPITHSDRFLLIDKQGNIRGTYHSEEPDELTKLISDAKDLAK